MTKIARSCALAALLATALLGAPARTAHAAPEGAASPNLVRALDDATLASPREALAPKRTLRLALVPVEFKDVKHDPRFTTDDLSRLVFSRGAYTGKNPTGEAVFGSVADYYAEVSSGLLSIEGRAHGWVQVRRERASYERPDAIGKALGFARFLTQALTALEAREGPKALADADAVGLVIAGDHGKHGSVLWPHSAAIPWRGRLLKYYLMSETQGGKFAPIGVHCHELGHVLGILDQYGEGKNSGLGTWCLMSTGHRHDRVNGDRRPIHMSAFTKERLGWVAPATVDPRVPQTLRLRPIEGNPGEALKVLVTPGGSEYFLLENRRKTGFNAGLARGGLYIWHVGEAFQALRNDVWAYSVDLEEAHGDETAKGPFKDLEMAAWPLLGKTAFTPLSSPGSTSWSLSALPVWITGIREEGSDIVLTIGAPAKDTKPATPTRAR